MANSLYEMRPQGIMVVLFPFQNDEYSFHDSLQAHLIDWIDWIMLQDGMSLKGTIN